jgi:alpha,alpha-trehalase
MSSQATGMQWDKPFEWAPAIYFAVTGMHAFGFSTAGRQALLYTTLIEENYAREGTLREKYNALTGGTDTPLSAGYRSNNAGFGWTNGVYLALLPLAQARSASHPSPAAP